MPLFDFLNIFKKPIDLMRTPDFVPEAAKKGIPLPAPKPAPSLPMTANINPPELPKPGFNPLPPPAPGARPEMLQPMQSPLQNARLAPPALPDNPFPRAQYDTMRKVLTSGETPIDRAGMNAAREQYVQEHSRRGFLQTLGNAGLGFLQGAAASPNNPLMGGLGGAAAAGIGSAISPKMGAEYRFNTIEAPQFEQALGMDQAEQMQRFKLAQLGAQISREREHARLYGSQADTTANRDAREQMRLPYDLAGKQADALLKEAQTGSVNERLRIALDDRKDRGDLNKLNRELKRMDMAFRGATDPIRRQQLQANYQKTQAQIDNLNSRIAARNTGGTPPGNAGTGTGRGTLTPSQRRTFYGALTKDIASFEQMKAQKPADDSTVQQEAERLRLKYGPEEVEIGTGQGGWLYAKPKLFPGSDLTIGEVRRQLRAKKWTDEQINQLFAEEGVR